VTLQRNNSSLYNRNHSQNGVLNNSLGDSRSVQSDLSLVTQSKTVTGNFPLIQCLMSVTSSTL